MEAWRVTQFLCLGPAAMAFRKSGNTETAEGILIAAGVGLLLDGACDALIFRAHQYAQRQRLAPTV